MTAAAKKLLESIATYTKPDVGKKGLSQDRPIVLGVVDPGYSGTGSARVTFDGESVLSGKSYVVTTSVVASQRVYLLPIGKSYVIAGVVGGTVRQTAGVNRYTTFGIITTTYATYPTLSLTTLGGGRSLLVHASATFVNPSSGSYRSADVRVQLDGATLDEEATGLLVPLIAGVGSSVSVNWADTYLVPAPITAASHTITLQARASAASSVSIVRASLVVEEVF